MSCRYLAIYGKTATILLAFGPTNHIENLLERYKKSFTLYVPEI